MKVVLGTFTRTGIEAFLGRDIAAGVQAALRHYTRRGGVDRGDARALPRFREYPLSRPGADLELTVDPEIAAELEREARESGGVLVEQVVARAVLVYLADLDRAPEFTAPPLRQV